MSSHICGICSPTGPFLFPKRHVCAHQGPSPLPFPVKMVRKPPVLTAFWTHMFVCAPVYMGEEKSFSGCLLPMSFPGPKLWM